MPNPCNADSQCGLLPCDTCAHISPGQQAKAECRIWDRMLIQHLLQPLQLIHCLWQPLLQVEEALVACKLRPDIRAQDLSLEQFTQLYGRLLHQQQ